MCQSSRNPINAAFIISIFVFPTAHRELVLFMQQQYSGRDPPVFNKLLWSVRTGSIVTKVTKVRFTLIDALTKVRFSHTFYSCEFLCIF